MPGSENKKRKSSEADEDPITPMATGTKEMSLKLVVDGKSKKVLYAEAKKDFIDFLFGLLQVPIGSIMTILEKNDVELGSLGRVRRSVSDMETSVFHSSELKDALVKPKVFSGQAKNSINPPLLLQEFASWEPTVQSQCCNNSGRRTQSCHHCRHACGTAVTTPPTKVEGYVKADNCAYMVMDDLVVCHMSTTSIFAVLNKFKIKDPGLLEEKIVKIDLKKGLALVQASMESDTVLTDIFTAHSRATKMEAS